MGYPETVAVDIVAVAGIAVVAARFVVPHSPAAKIPPGTREEK
jgi:hypothetical protein